MSGHRQQRRGLFTALAAGLVLIVLGVIGYKVEGSQRRERPDGVGFGLPWSHELHARHPDYSCQSCHHKSRAGQSQMEACGDCHPTSPDLGQTQPEPSKATDRRHALHSSCVGCHKAVSKGPTECADCHRPGHGTKACATCHGPTLEELAQGGHAGVACESCHTTNARELVNDQHPAKVPSAESQEACLACHGLGAEPDAAGFPRKRLDDCPARDQLDEGNRRQCLDCHQAHAPQDAKRAASPRRRIPLHRLDELRRQRARRQAQPSGE